MEEWGRACGQRAPMNTPSGGGVRSSPGPALLEGCAWQLWILSPVLDSASLLQAPAAQGVYGTH